jgi:hypothetical protein
MMVVALPAAYGILSDGLPLNKQSPKIADEIKTPCKRVPR